jgi:multidrug efflux pump subunit AcrB
VRRAYTLVLSALLSKRAGFIGCSSASACCPACCTPSLGRDFFPSVDAGQIRLHMRAPTGTRIEETARLADQVEAAIRELVPPDQLETILDNLGVPNSGINLSYSNAGTIGTLGRRDPAVAEGRPQADRALRVGAARRAAQALSRAWSSSSSRPTSSRRS